MTKEVIEAIVIFTMGCLLIYEGIHIRTKTFLGALLINFMTLIIGWTGIMMALNMLGIK